MKGQHRATADESFAAVTHLCILELLHRIEALEANQHAHADASHVIDPEKEKMAQEVMQAAGFAPRSSEGELRAAAQPAKSNHPAKPDSSLVDRVACAIYPDGSGDGFREEAREAIREVAAWLREEKPRMAGNCSSFASSLEQEAER